MVDIGGGMIPAVYAPEYAQIDRRRQMAQALRNQAFQQEQPQFVGGHYVGAAPLASALQKGMQLFAGMQGERNADQELQSLNQRRQSALANTLRDYQAAQSGVQAPTTPFDDEGNQNPVVQGLPDQQAALAALLRNPDTQQLAFHQIQLQPQLDARRLEREDQRQFQREQLQSQIEAKKQAAEDQRAFLREMKKLGGGQGGQPYFQPVQTGEGVMAFNARTGRIEPVLVDGKPVIGSASNPQLQEKLAGAKSSGTTEGKATTERRLEAPQVIQQGEQTIQLVDDMLKAPGFKQAVGASRLLGVQNIPGTAAKDFDVRLDQLKGQQFLQAFQSLKGGGQITEVEGKKATDAISRMNAASSEKEFINAAREFQDVIRTGVNRAKNAAPNQAGNPIRVRRFNPATGQLE